MATNHRVLVRVVNRDHPAWDEARLDVNAAYLPWACRELLDGREQHMVILRAEYHKLDAHLSGQPAFAKNPAPLVTLEDAPAPPPDEPESERAVACGKLAEIITAAGGTSPYGGTVTRHPKGKYYAVSFSRSNKFAGEVQMYSPEYVRVVFVANWDGLPAAASRVYGSADDAAKFLALVLYSGKVADALAIPVRPAAGGGRRWT